MSPPPAFALPAPRGSSRRRACRLAAGALAIVLSAGTAAAEPADPSCAGGLVLDDGSFENAYTLLPAAQGRMAMLFEPPAGALLSRVCLCWIRSGADDTLSFDLVFYAADGPGGEPGTPLASVPAVAAAVPTTPPGGFYGYELGAAAVEVPEGGLYVGAGWSSAAEPGFFLCADQDGHALHPGYLSVDGGATWRDIAFDQPGYRALGVRAELAGCVPGPETLCLGDGRFEARLTWRTRNGRTGPGKAVPVGSTSSGLFYFFREANWEMLLKVLPGCAVNGHHWVLFAAVTNVELNLTVTDTQTHLTRTYRNPQGQPADTVADLTAFPCP